MKSEDNTAEADLSSVASYYTDKAKQFGATAKGVDWKDNVSQNLRFQQLLKVLEGQEGFSITDIGCGYGELCIHLQQQGYDCRYIGLDISETMLELAKKSLAQFKNAELVCSSSIPFQSDYSVASGIFNVSLEQDKSQWLDYIKSTIMSMKDKSTRGFAFNCLTSYSDVERMEDRLYYANPLEIFDFCKRNCSKNVALLHDYGLYEFTILVRV